MRDLKRNKSCQMPTRMIFFDTETDQRGLTDGKEGVENVFRLGCASFVRLDKSGVSRRDSLRFGSTEEFWDWVESKTDRKTQTYIFAHNLGFDATISGLWMELDKGRFRLSDSAENGIRQFDKLSKTKTWKGLFVREDPPTIVKCRTRDNATLTFCDTLNWFKTSLAKLGERMGVSKLEIDFKACTEEELYTYCEQDVSVIEFTMLEYIKWLRENDLGNFKLTAPSQAYTAFNHRFRVPRIVLHQKPEVQKLERRSYYGGRLESYYIGTVKSETFSERELCGPTETGDKSSRSDTCFGVDVNSLYPSVMRKLPYPTGLEEHVSFRNPEPVANVPLCHRCIAEVHLSASDTFPRRVESIGIVFARGNFRTTLCGPELMRAFRSGSITHVYEFARYSLKPLFTPYVDFFWNERLKAKAAGDTIGDHFAKLFLNSLYGKFAQLSINWEIAPPSVSCERWKQVPEIRLFSGETVSLQNIAGVTYVKRERKERPESFYAISAWVAAYARERMLELMRIAGIDNVFYIVTDGLFIDDEGYRRLFDAGEVVKNELGKLSLKTSCETGWLGGIHWYEVGEVIKQGSNKKRAVVLSTGHALQERWERLSGVLKRGPTDTVRIYPQAKHYKREYKKGTVLPNGNVVPIVYSEPLEASN